ncbi:potassium-transporting ATPase subunit KdpC [Kerstersia gyiorum]|uniref:potassium-transporting ATPase subunit KdpC n=1 Tax=Kerstersia gyiorum TaxID=206506 RepID=UPI0039E99C19
MALLAMVGLGLLYPLAGVGLGQALFPQAANGSLLARDGVIVGSALVAQPFHGAEYFHPRPSAAGYDPLAAAGSNQARSNPALQERLDAARLAAAAREQIPPADVPADLITQSGSGLDPHISPQAAAVQVYRVARARGVMAEHVQALLARQLEPRQFGLLGQPRVNVLALNLALDRLLPVQDAGTVSGGK